MHQIRIISGPRAGQILALDSQYSYSVGRGDDAHMSVPEDNTLSRVHAEVVPQGAAWLLRNKSKHGSLIAGTVVQGDQALTAGTTFQLGETQFSFEAAGAEALPGAVPAVPSPAVAGGAPAAAGGAPPAAGGAPAAGGGPTGANVAAAGAAVGAGAAAAGAALAGLAAGPFELPAEIKAHTGPGFPFVPLVKGGLAITKANLVPSLLIFGITFVQIAASVVFGLIGLSILAMPLQILSLAYILIIPNYFAGVKKFLADGTPISIGSLFSFEDIVNRVIVGIIVGVASMCFGLGTLLMPFAMAVQIDHPGQPFMDSVKGALAWTMKDLVPRVIQIILLFIVLGIVNFCGALALILGLFIALPTNLCAFWLAYDLKRDEVAAAAAEKGITFGAAA